jgi:hypothetical protein
MNANTVAFVDFVIVVAVPFLLPLLPLLLINR